MKLKNKGNTNRIKNRLKLEERPGMQIQSISYGTNEKSHNAGNEVALHWNTDNSILS